MLTKKFCPKCRSENVEMIAGGTYGMWMCRDCGFSGSVFPEKPIVGSETKEKNDTKRNRRRQD